MQEGFVCYRELVRLRINGNIILQILGIHHAPPIHTYMYSAAKIATRTRSAPRDGPVSRTSVLQRADVFGPMEM